MTNDECINALNRIADYQDEHKFSDVEVEHGQADELLLALIDDEDVTKAYNRIRKWYA